MSPNGDNFSRWPPAAAWRAYWPAASLTIALHKAQKSPSGFVRDALCTFGPTRTLQLTNIHPNILILGKYYVDNSVKKSTLFDCHCECISNKETGNLLLFVHFPHQNQFCFAMVPKYWEWHQNVTSFASFHNWMEKIWNWKQNINFKQSIVIASDIYMTRAFSKINTDLIRCYWGVFNLTTKLCKCVVRRDDTKYPFSENHLYIDSRMAPATCRYLLGCVKVYFLFINLAENIENWTYFQFSGSVV